MGGRKVKGVGKQRDVLLDHRGEGINALFPQHALTHVRGGAMLTNT